MHANSAPTALVVDDDAEIRENLGDILRLDGYRFDEAATIGEAREMARLHHYDAIILDRQLPDGTAIELLPLLRKSHPDAAIIIATHCAHVNDVIVAIRHDATDFILKPVCPDLLRSSLRRSWELRDARQHALQCERLAAIGTVVAGVAHESRNALQRILSGVDLIRLSNEANADLMEDVAIIEKAATELQSHFEELREFSAPINLSTMPCAINGLAQRVWKKAMYSARCTEARIEIPDRDVECLIDPIKIGQVLRNLFENALSACPSAAVVRVDYSVDTEADSLVSITITDNGPGLDDEQRQHAFDPFFTTTGGGTGLGLLISRRIAEAHGGSLCINTSHTDGAMFELCLPIATAAASKQSVAGPARVQTSPTLIRSLATPATHQTAQ